jgi:S1-C subfamily serine protease
MSGNGKFRWFLVAPIVIAILFIANFSEGQSESYKNNIRKAMELDQLKVDLRWCRAMNIEGSIKCEEIEKALEAAKIRARPVEERKVVIIEDLSEVYQEMQRQDSQAEFQEFLGVDRDNRNKRKEPEYKRYFEGFRLSEKNRQLEDGRKKVEEEKRQLEDLRLAEEQRLEEKRKKLEAVEQRQQQAQDQRGQPPQASIKQNPQSGTGSGFFVSKMGHVITNAHVVQNCKKVTIGDNVNKQAPAKLINTDRSNDLALLQLSTLEMASAESRSLIQKLRIVAVPLAVKGLLRSDDVRLGEKVLVAGYPYGDLFSNTIKVTSGIVSATRGLGDDSGQFQLDAAVQPGNSGGPIYDSAGNIVGVVVSQLNKLNMAKAIGSLPENVNFGIKASTVKQFLISSGLPSKKAEQAEEKSTEQLAAIAKNQALMVMCLQ